MGATKEKKLTKKQKLIQRWHEVAHVVAASVYSPAATPDDELRRQEFVRSYVTRKLGGTDALMPPTGTGAENTKPSEWATDSAERQGNLEGVRWAERMGDFYGFAKCHPTDAKNLPELYLVHAGEGSFSCLGFDVALKWAKGYAEWAGIPLPDPAKRGTVEGYADYLRCQNAASIKNQQTKERCPIHLTPQLAGLEHKRVEVVDHYGETRRFIVGKSCGWSPCHLEIARRGSSGGPAVTGVPFESVRVIG